MLALDVMSLVWQILSRQTFAELAPSFQETIVFKATLMEYFIHTDKSQSIFKGLNGQQQFSSRKRSLPIT